MEQPFADVRALLIDLDGTLYQGEIQKATCDWSGFSAQKSR